MNPAHIRNRDLNLLVIFDALMVERNMTRAANRLGLTQSAVSHALKRLRNDFDDDLLVRGAKGMIPTRLALQLRDKLASLVQDLERFYRLDEMLDLKKLEARITIATTDYIEAILFPGLLRFLGEKAPGITLVSRPTSGALPQTEMETGAIDLAIAGYFSDLPNAFYLRRLFSDTYCAAVRKGHPLLKAGRLTLKDYAAANHVLISPQGDLKARMDVELKKVGLKRRIVAGMSGFLSSAWIVAESDLVLTALSRDLTAFSHYFPLEVFPTPINLPPVHTTQVWHERTHRSRLHQWFRLAMEQIAQPTLDQRKL